MVQSSERISLWWAVMGSRVNAAGTEEDNEGDNGRGRFSTKSQHIVQFSI